MNEYTVNFVLSVISLILLFILLHTSFSSVKPQSQKEFRRVVGCFMLTSALQLISLLLFLMPGQAVRIIIIAVETVELLTASFSYLMLISYLNTDGISNVFAISGTRNYVVFLMAVTIVNALLVISNLFTHCIFMIQADFRIVFGPLYMVPDLLILVQIIAESLIIFRHPERKNRRIVIFAMMFIMACSLISDLINPGIRMLYPLSTLSLLLIYVNNITETEMNLRHQETELKKNRISLLIRQVQPHFVFNVLNTIYYLCDDDPLEARRATEHFRLYLQNSLEKRYIEEPIPFENELEAVNHYTDLEKLRFDSIEIIYDIQDTGFRIPAFTVQPLVENAIRHGCREMSGGRIIISSRKEGKDHIVTVRDNGVGYTGIIKKDGRRHVGIENVRQRLTLMSGAELSIQALAEGGTAATIRIPE